MKFTWLNNFGYFSHPYQELPLYEIEHTNNECIFCCPQFTPEFRCFLFRCWTLIIIFLSGLIYLIYYLSKL